MENIRKALNKTSQMMQKLAQAGLTEELINNIINSPGNQMAETMVASISGKVKNKLLTEIHRDETAIVLKMYGLDACFEDLFGLLCDHVKQKDVNGIPTLIKKLKENNLLFSSKKVGVDYIKSGVKSGIHKKGFTVGVNDLSDDYEWIAIYGHRIVVPATKTLGTQS